MIPSQDAIGQLAGRIERAYRRRNPLWTSAGMTAGVWESAAARLSEAAAVEPSIPIDPELFVAAQAMPEGRRDPWAELTQHRSLKRYILAVRKMVGQLREELRQEVRRAERRLLRGVTLDELMARESGRISPLTLYILAHRAGRYDLSDRLLGDVEDQHRSCPLYRLASRTLLPSHAYPSARHVATSRGERDIIAFSLN